MTKHIHSELIKAWADGEIIQFRATSEENWASLDSQTGPAWYPFYEYRIKPKFKTAYQIIADNLFPSCAPYSAEEATKIFSEEMKAGIKELIKAVKENKSKE